MGKEEERLEGEEKRLKGEVSKIDRGRKKC
jgi:hypothetical protein